jgi:hypothetical protein
MMRGKPLHNNRLLGPVEGKLVVLGCSTHQEHPVQLSDRRGFSDLFAQTPLGPWSIEGETSGHRVVNDVNKALALHAAMLIIVTTTTAKANSIKRIIRSVQNHIGALKVFVGTVPQVLGHIQALADACPQWSQKLPAKQRTGVEPSAETAPDQPRSSADGGREAA